MVRLQVKAKIPSLVERTTHTLVSLTRLLEVLRELPSEASASCIQVKEAPAITESLAG